MQKTAFLDSLHTLLLETLAREFDGYQPPELTESRVEELRAEQLLFYTTAQLEAFNSHKARSALLVIRRRTQFPLMEGIEKTQPESYCNLYISYLNTRTDNQFVSEIEKMGINSESLLIRLLRLSKLSHSYEQYKNITFFIVNDVESLLKGAVIEINRELPSYQPVWLYKFLFSFLKSRDNSSRAHRVLFAELVNRQDIATNFYLQQINPAERYREFYKLLLTLENPYIKNLTGFLDTIKKLSERGAKRGGIKQRLTLDTELLKMQSELATLSTHFSSLTQFTQLLQNSRNSLEKRIGRRRSEIENHLLYADEKTALRYSTSPLLNRERRHLLQLLESGVLSREVLTEALPLSIRFIPALTSALAKRYGESFGDYSFLHDLVENEKWGNSFEKVKVESFLIECSAELEKILPLLERRPQVVTSKFIRDSFVKERFDSFHEQLKLLSLLSNSSEQAKMLSYARDLNRTIELADNLRIIEQYVKQNFDQILNEFDNLTQENLVNLISIIHHDGALPSRLMNYLMVRNNRDNEGIAALCGFIASQLFINPVDNDAIGNFHDQVIKNFLDLDSERGAYAFKFLQEVTESKKIDNYNNLLEQIKIRGQSKYKELPYEMIAYYCISMLMYPQEDAEMIKKITSHLVNELIEDQFMGSEKLRNLRELLKISLYIHDPLELDLDYQRLNNINFDLTQNNQLHKIIELVETLISFVKAEKLLKDGEKCDRNTLAILKKKQYSARISRIISLDEGNNILDQALGKQLFSLIEFLLQSTTRENIEEQNKIGKIISSNLYNSLMDMTYILQEEAAQDNLENLDKSNAAILVKNFYMVRNFLDKYYDDKRKIGGTLKKDLYYQVQQILISFDVIDRVDNFDILCNFSQSVKATCDTGEDSLLVFFTDTKLSGLFKFIKQMLSVHKETALELLTTYIERLKKLADTSYQQEIFNKILNEQSVLFEEGETREIREQVIEHLDFLSVKSLIRASTSRQFASSRSSTSSKGSTGKRVNPKKEKRKIFR